MYIYETDEFGRVDKSVQRTMDFAYVEKNNSDNAQPWRSARIAWVFLGGLESSQGPICSYVQGTP
jgi:hypothetical protein